MRTHFPLHLHKHTPYIRLDTSLCRACWDCIAVCPRHVLGKIDLPFHKHARIDLPEACKGCQLCVKACPNGAILTITKNPKSLEMP